jgi:NAD(P)-dependent dehydrogenase (short-subunit alcohol dehydrogenase family)
MLRFAGQVFLVTGAARGIGRAIAKRLHVEGASVIAADIDEQTPGDDSASSDAGVWLDLKLDVTHGAAISAAAELIQQRFGALNGLVNNASVLDHSSLRTLDVENYRRVMSANLDSVLFMTHAMLPLLEAGAPSAVLNIASIMGMYGAANSTVYATAKAGVINLTRSMAVELAPAGIRVNAIAPGFIETRMARLPDGSSEYATDEFRDVYLKHKKLPAGTPGIADDIAGPAAFLLSSDARYVTGQTLAVDGGVTATF